MAQQRDPWERPGPSIKEKKAVADVAGTEASTTRTETLTPLDAEGVFLQNQERRRKLGLPVLTPAQEEADKTFAKEYVGWRNTGGMGTLVRQLDQLQNALNLLRTNDTITGPVLGRMPEFIQQAIDPNAVDVREQVEDVIQRSLRQILGAQFTQAEGERMISRAYNPKLEEQTNIGRLTRILGELRQQGAAKEASSRYFENKGTLQGFKQGEVDKVLKDYGTANVPSGGQPWLRPEQEQVVVEYAGRPNFTAQGYADLLTRMAQDQGFQPDEAWRAKALEMGRQAEEYRKSGGTYGENVMYLNGLPKPEEGEKREDQGAPLIGAVAPGGTGGGGNAPPPAGPDGLSWGEAGLSAATNFLPNLVDVGVETAKGLGQVVAHPIDTATAVGQLANSALGKLGITDADPMLIDAVGQHFVDKYGSAENFKNTLANEPASVLFDLSALLTAGGGAIAKGGSMLGNISKLSRIAPAVETAGRGVGIAGRIIDPLSASIGITGKGAELVNKYLPEGLRDVAGTTLSNLTQKYPAAAYAMPSGVGGETVQEAVGAGRSSGRALGSTPRSTAFRGQQVGDAPAREIVDELRSSVERIRDAASKRYETDILPITRDKTDLSAEFGDIEKAVANLRPSTLGRYQTKRTPSSHAAWGEANNMVAQHRALIDQDPARYATPQALDDFKQTLYDTLSGYVEGSDRSAKRIATRSYNAVKDVLKKHAPDYERTMNDYSTARQNLADMERTFSLGGNIDTSVRRIQNVLSRNDPGHAGELLQAADEGNVATLAAGRSGRPVTPTKLRSALIAAQGVGAGMSMLPTEWLAQAPDIVSSASPGLLASAALMSPRVATSGAYRFGQGIGAVEAGADKLADFYNRYPEVFSAGVAGTSNAQEIAERQRREELLRQYGVGE